MRHHLTASLCIALALSLWLLPSCARFETVPLGSNLSNLPLLQPGRTMRASSSADPNWYLNNADARPIAPGETLVIADLEGPGVIRHIWNTIAAHEQGHQKKVVIRMYWDGEAYPSVQAPLGDFFGIGHGMDQAYASQPVMVSSEGRARNCYWPMPFRKSARITVSNEGEEAVQAFYWYVDWQQVPRIPRNVGYFHAMYRQEYPCTPGENYLFADIQGRGQYVGTALSVLQRTPSWWGEGDDFFYIDGEEEPSIKGTGSEDYFCDAWGFRQFDGPFYGVPVMEGYDAYDRTSVYRWHIHDPITFEKSLRAEIEHYGVAFHEDGSMKTGFGERDDYFSSVAFWYQEEPHTPFPDLPPAADRLYFDYLVKIEAEDQIQAMITDEPVLEQEGGTWSGNGQLFWMAREPNRAIEIPFDVPEAGRYLLVPLLTHSYDYGVFRLELDGEPLGPPRDLHSGNVVTREVVSGVVDLDAGRHVLKVVNVGKGGASTGYYFGIDAIYLAAER